MALITCQFARGGLRSLSQSGDAPTSSTVLERYVFFSRPTLPAGTCACMVVHKRCMRNA